jgi:hypothetical protein
MRCAPSLTGGGLRLAYASHEARNLEARTAPGGSTSRAAFEVEYAALDHDEAVVGVVGANEALAVVEPVVLGDFADRSVVVARIRRNVLPAGI